MLSTIGKNIIEKFWKCCYNFIWFSVYFQCFICAIYGKYFRLFCVFVILNIFFYEILEYIECSSGRNSTVYINSLHPLISGNKFFSVYHCSYKMQQFLDYSLKIAVFSLRVERSFNWYTCIWIKKWNQFLNEI